MQEVDLQCRVVYVDNDPMVREQAGELLTDRADVRVVLGDLRDPDGVLANPDLRALIDFRQPAGPADDRGHALRGRGVRAAPLLARYLDVLAPGSYLALSHLTADQKPPRAVAEFRHVFDRATEQVHFRPKTDIERLFAGLELVSPYRPGTKGRLMYAGDWGAVDPALADSDGSRWLYCGVARRP